MQGASWTCSFSVHKRKLVKCYLFKCCLPSELREEEDNAFSHVCLSFSSQGIPCDHYSPWLGPHHTGTSSAPGPSPGQGNHLFRATLPVTSVGQDQRPVQTYSLEDLFMLVSSGGQDHRSPVLTSNGWLLKHLKVNERGVRILHENFLVEVVNSGYLDDSLTSLIRVEASTCCPSVTSIHVQHFTMQSPCQPWSRKVFCTFSSGENWVLLKSTLPEILNWFL